MCISVIGKPRTNIIARATSNVIKLLEDKGIETVLQWIPSHVGILGNMIVDLLAAEAHHSQPSVKAPDDL